MTTKDPFAVIAEYLGITPAEAGGMTRDELTDARHHLTGGRPEDEELLVQPFVIAELVSRTALCPDCDSEHLMRVHRDEAGELDFDIVVGHSDTCPTLDRQERTS